MNRFISFFLGNKTRLLFLFYFLIAIGLSVQFRSFHQSKYLNSSWAVSGSIFSKIARLDNYLSLDKTNALLVEENKRLQEALYNSSYQQEDSLHMPYEVVPTTVVKNSYRFLRNYLTIDSGTDQGINQDMGVINQNGIVGIIETSAAHYSTVQSILNVRSKINAKIASSEYFGSLIWDGTDPSIVQLVDIPNVATIKMGDSIVTGGMSSIFPAQLPIGVVSSFKLNEAKSDYIINVKLFNDLRALRKAYVIINKDQKEVQYLDAISGSR